MHSVVEILKFIAVYSDKIVSGFKSAGFNLGDIAQGAAFFAIFLGYIIFKYIDWRANLRKVEAEYDGILSARSPATAADMRKANDALKSLFGRKHFVSLDQYRALIARNDHVLTVIIDENNEMVGYFDVFPLVDAFGESLIKGNVTELDMHVNCEYDKSVEHESNHIYLGAIFNLERKHLTKRYAISLFMQKKLIMHILLLYPPRAGRKYIALASSAEGNNILKRYNFSHTQSKRDRKDKADLFVLDSADMEDTIYKIKKRFGEIYIENKLFDYEEFFKNNAVKNSILRS
jgi:hypothetical protein